MFKQNSPQVIFPIFIAWLALVLSAAPCASNTKVLGTADSLIALHKYETAFQLLVSADPQNQDLDISIKKSFIAMNFYVNATKHRIFGFHDIMPDRDMESIRGRPDILPKYDFPIDNIMLAAIKKYPDRCEPYRILAEFYSETRDIYGKDWDIPADSQKKLSKYYGDIAIKKGCADWKTYNILGLYELFDSNYVKGIEYLSKSTALTDTIPAVTFNLAYAYLLKDKSDSTIKYAKRAMKYFPKNEPKANSARIIAEAYRKLKENPEVWAWCDSAVRLDSSTANNRAGVLDLCLATNNYQKAFANALTIFNLAPESPGNLNAIVVLFFKNKMEDSLPSFFQALLKKVSQDTTKKVLLDTLKTTDGKLTPKVITRYVNHNEQALGIIYFNEGVYYLQKKNDAECKKAITTAKGYFESDPVKNKKVIDIIDSKLKEFKH